MKSIKILLFSFCLVLIGCLTVGCEKEVVPAPVAPEEPQQPTPEPPVVTEDDPENGVIIDQPGITLKGWIHCERVGIAGVVVTDGTNVTITDQKGIYRLKRNSDATLVYLSSPAGYSVKTDNSVPQFYARLNEKNEIEHKDFELIKLKSEDNTHTFIAIGDPQLYRDHEINYMRAAIDDLKYYIDQNYNDKNVHYITLGDLVFDKPQYHKDSKTIFSRLNAPVYNVIGNHDHVFNASEAPSKINDLKSDTLYKRLYGPTYYSYNRGEVHYVGLDDIEYLGGSKQSYNNAISDAQIAWLQKDLSYVPKSKAVVVYLHAPTKRRTSSATIGNREKLYNLLSGYANVHILSGHTHWNSVVKDNSPIVEHIVAALCGNWWQPELLCSEGTPIGYKVFEVDGTKIKWRYKCVSSAIQYQMKAYAPDNNRKAELRPSDVVVNVWDWDPDWKVEYSENEGQKYFPMIRNTSMYDIAAYTAFGAAGDTSFPASRTWIDASKSDHMFYCRPTIPYNRMKIRVTSAFGEIFSTSVNILSIP